MYAAQPSIPGDRLREGVGILHVLAPRPPILAVQALLRDRDSRVLACADERGAALVALHPLPLGFRDVAPFLLAAARQLLDGGAIAELLELGDGQHAVEGHVVAGVVHGGAGAAQLAAAPFGSAGALHALGDPRRAAASAARPRLRSTSVRGRLSSVATMATIAFASSMSSHTTAWQRASLFLHMAL